MMTENRNFTDALRTIFAQGRKGKTMRLIDADAFLKEYCEPYPHIYQAMSSAFKHAPKVDAVPVIRCKDCKYYTGKWCTKFSTKQFDINDIYKADDDFCSMAERKEE